MGLVDRVQGDGDIDMGGNKRLIVGGAELNFKRDHMEIQPLLQETGISKIMMVKRDIVNFDYLEDILKKSLVD